MLRFVRLFEVERMSQIILTVSYLNYLFILNLKNILKIIYLAIFRVHLRQFAIVLQLAELVMVKTHLALLDELGDA